MLSKQIIIKKFVSTFEKTDYKNNFKTRLLPYGALATSLDLKLWFDKDGFEFRIPKGMMGRGKLIFKTPNLG